MKKDKLTINKILWLIYYKSIYYINANIFIILGIIIALPIDYLISPEGQMWIEIIYNGITNYDLFKDDWHKIIIALAAQIFLITTIHYLLLLIYYIIIKVKYKIGYE